MLARSKEPRKQSRPSSSAGARAVREDHSAVPLATHRSERHSAKLLQLLHPRPPCVGRVLPVPRLLDAVLRRFRLIARAELSVAETHAAAAVCADRQPSAFQFEAEGLQKNETISS